MQAFVSDQSSSFNAVDIGTAPNSTIVASLKLPPGSWVVFATVALGAATSTPGTTTVQMFFQLDGNLYGTSVQTDFHHLGSIWHHQRFSGCPLHHGIGARHAENSAGRVCGD